MFVLVKGHSLPGIELVNSTPTYAQHRFKHKRELPDVDQEAVDCVWERWGQCMWSNRCLCIGLS